MLVILVPHHSFDMRCGFSMVLLSGALPSVALNVRTYPGCARLEELGWFLPTTTVPRTVVPVALLRRLAKELVCSETDSFRHSSYSYAVQLLTFCFSREMPKQLRQ